MGTLPEDPSDDLRLDRTHFSVVHLTDPDDSLEYWLSRRVEERLQALGHLRRTFYGQSATARIQKAIVVVRLEDL
jgi:hypothetical protein